MERISEFFISGLSNLLVSPRATAVAPSSRRSSSNQVAPVSPVSHINNVLPSTPILGAHSPDAAANGYGWRLKVNQYANAASSPPGLYLGPRLISTPRSETRKTGPRSVKEAIVNGTPLPRSTSTPPPRFRHQLSSGFDSSSPPTSSDGPSSRFKLAIHAVSPGSEHAASPRRRRTLANAESNLEQSPAGHLPRRNNSHNLSEDGLSKFNDLMLDDGFVSVKNVDIGQSAPVLRHRSTNVIDSDRKNRRRGKYAGAAIEDEYFATVDDESTDLQEGKEMNAKRLKFEDEEGKEVSKDPDDYGSDAKHVKGKGKKSKPKPKPKPEPKAKGQKARAKLSNKVDLGDAGTPSQALDQHKHPSALEKGNSLNQSAGESEELQTDQANETSDAKNDHINELLQDLMRDRKEDVTKKATKVKPKKSGKPGPKKKRGEKLKTSLQVPETQGKSVSSEELQSVPLPLQEGISVPVTPGAVKPIETDEVAREAEAKAEMPIEATELEQATLSAAPPSDSNDFQTGDDFLVPEPQPQVRKAFKWSFRLANSLARALNMQIGNAAHNEFRTRDMFFGLDTQRSNLAELLRNAHQKHESVNVLMVGAAGTGKHHCLYSALQDISPLRYRVVMLDGKVLTDDRIAAREMSRQLSLSHHTGLAASLEMIDTGESGDVDDEDEPVAPQRKGLRVSLSEHLKFFLSVLKNENKALGKKSERLLFHLNNFDIFAKRAKQTLLFSLVDLAHNPDAKFVIVASTNSPNCMASLDKRLKSRFDFVSMHFPARPYAMDEVMTLLNSRILVKDESEWNSFAESNLENLKLTIENLILIQGMSVGNVIQWVLSRLSCLALKQDRGGDVPQSITTLSQAKIQAQASIVKNLSRDEVALVLSAIYLERVARKDACSFAGMFEALLKMRRGPPESNLDERLFLEIPRREESLMHFQTLLRARLFIPFGITRRSVPREYQLVRLNVCDVDQDVLQLVERAMNVLPLPLVYWAKKLRSI